MSRHPNRLPAQPGAVPSLATMLGTSDRAKQESRVAQLLLATQQSSYFLLITWNPLTHQAEMIHSRDLSPAQVMQGFNLGRAHLDELLAKRKSMRAEEPAPEGIAGDPFVVQEPLIGEDGQPRLAEGAVNGLD